jgi:hypothetical protein
MGWRATTPSAPLAPHRLRAPPRHPRPVRRMHACYGGRRAARAPRWRVPPRAPSPPECGHQREHPLASSSPAPVCAPAHARAHRRVALQCEWLGRLAIALVLAPRGARVACAARRCQRGAHTSLRAPRAVSRSPRRAPSRLMTINNHHDGLMNVARHQRAAPMIRLCSFHTLRVPDSSPPRCALVFSAFLSAPALHTAQSPHPSAVANLR